MRSVQIRYGTFYQAWWNLYCGQIKQSGLRGPLICRNDRCRVGI